MHKSADGLSADLRKNTRITVSIPVDVAEGGARCAFGKVTDISRDGMAVEVFPLLTLNKVYRFRIRNFDTLSGKVIRRFGIKSHGIIFQVDDIMKVKIDRDILGK